MQRFGKSVLSFYAPAFLLSSPSSQICTECLFPTHALWGLGSLRQVQLFMCGLCSRSFILLVQLAHLQNSGQNGHFVTLLQGSEEILDVKVFCHPLWPGQMQGIHTWSPGWSFCGCLPPSCLRNIGRWNHEILGKNSTVWRPESFTSSRRMSCLPDKSKIWFPLFETLNLSWETRP